MRRAANDEKLYTIAKKLSHGECISKSWLKQSKRLVPLLPNLIHQNSKASYYRILADHILKKATPILKLYPEPIETSLYALNDLIDEDDGDVKKATTDDNVVEMKSSSQEADPIGGSSTTKKKRKKCSDDNDEDERLERKFEYLMRSINEMRPPVLAEKDQNLAELNNGYLINTDSILSKRNFDFSFDVYDLFDLYICIFIC